MVTTNGGPKEIRACKWSGPRPGPMETTDYNSKAILQEKKFQEAFLEKKICVQYFLHPPLAGFGWYDIGMTLTKIFRPVLA